MPWLFVLVLENLLKFNPKSKTTTVNLWMHCIANIAWIRFGSPDPAAYKFSPQFYWPPPGWFARNLAIRKSTNREMKAPCHKIVAAGAGHRQGATSHPTPSSP